MFPSYLFLLYPLIVKATFEECTHNLKVCLSITLQGLLSRSMDYFLVLRIMGKMSKSPRHCSPGSVPLHFSLPGLLCSSLSFRSFLILASPVVSFSYFPFLIIHSPSYLQPVIIFLWCHLKKWTWFSKWACIIKSYETLAAWLGWSSDGANEIQVRGMSPYGTFRFFFV